MFLIGCIYCIYNYGAEQNEINLEDICIYINKFYNHVNMDVICLGLIYFKLNI